MAVYFIRGLGVQIYRIHGKTDTGFKMGASLPLPVTVCIDAFCLIFLSVSACHSPQPVLTMVNFLAFFLSLFAQSSTYPCVSQSILCLCLVLLLSVFWNHNRVPADFSVVISS